MDCLFCKIIRGDIPSDRVYEDEHVIAFLDIFPTNPGHTLIVPKAHYRNVLDAPVEVWEQCMRGAKKIAQAMMQGLDASGVNILQNNEAGAGQVIFHLHVHVIPRYEHDGLTHWPSTKYNDDEEKKRVMENIRSSINQM